MPENENPETAVAVQDENAAPEKDGALAINAAALPARSLAAEKVTDVLPYAAYERVGQFVLSPEAEQVLNEPLPDNEVDIRPDDGMIYASHEFYRRQLNRAFGRMQWTLVPGSPLTQRPGTNEWYQRWVLFIGGIYCAEAFESYDYQPNNARMDLSDVAEAIKSGALKRCCKDLGVASECWNKRFQQQWKHEHAVQVVAKVWRKGQEVNAKLWRRRDADPLPGEQTSQQRQAAATDTANPASAGAVKAPTPTTAPTKQPPIQARPTGRTAGLGPANEGSSPSPETKAGVAQTAEQGTRKAQVASSTAAASSNTANQAPRLLDSQIRLLFARGRNVGLIMGDDASRMLEYIAELAVLPINQDGKTSMEICHEAFKNVPPNQFATLVKKLDGLTKATRPAESGDAEKI